MNVPESINKLNKLENTLNKLINKNDLNIKTNELLNELLETLKVIDNCTSCKDKETDGNCPDKIEKCLAELEKERRWEERYELNNELFRINIRLNKKVLCEDCKGKKIGKLTYKCGNEELARFLYSRYIRWIPFDELKNIEYLAKDGFGEVHKATWINGRYDRFEKKYKDRDFVLKRIYNNSSDNKIVDILNEVK